MSAKSKRTLFVRKILYLEPATCACKNGSCVESIIDNSVITCDEIIKETKTVSTKSTLTKAVLTKSTS